MVTLILLGSARISGATGTVTGRIAQRRQMGLLALLALSDASRASRDKLMALLWPEGQTERARRNLADAVYVIRRGLGDEAIVNEGDDLVLNPSVIATDVSAFRAALGGADYAGAVAIYRGPIMDGFHLGAGNEFEQWLESARTRYAQLYVGALEKLADQYQREGCLSEALEVCSLWAAAEPLSTRSALALMGAYAASGDRAAAIRYVDVHRARLAAELGVEADPQVREYAEELRRWDERLVGAHEMHRSIAVDSAVGYGIRADQELPVTAEPQVVSHRVRSAGVTGRDRLRGVSKLAVAAAAVALAGMGVVVGSGRGDLNPERVVVLPFNAPDSAEDLGRWAAAIISVGVVQAEVGEAVIHYEAALWVSSVEGAAAPRIHSAARHFGAGTVVTGDIYHVDGATLISSRILDGADGSVIAAVGPIRVNGEDVSEGVEQIRDRVIGALASHFSRRNAAHPYVMRTPTLQSFRAGDHASSVFLARNFSEAARHFRRAYDLDTTAVGFLLWSAIAHLNDDNFAMVDSLLAMLRPRLERLDRFDGLQFEWLQSKRAGDRAASLRYAEAAHSLAPYSGLGGYQLGFELLIAGRPRDAITMLLRLDPGSGWLSGWANYWLRLAAAYHHVGEHENELRAARMHSDRSGNRETELRALAALNRPDEVAALLAEIPPDVSYNVIKELQVHGGGDADVRLLAGIALAESRADTTARRLAWGWRLHEALLVMHTGDTAGALELLERLHTERPGNTQVICWMGVLSARLGNVADAERAFAMLAELPDEGKWVHPARMAAVAATINGGDIAAVKDLLKRARDLGMTMYDMHAQTPFLHLRDQPELREFFQLAVDAGHTPRSGVALRSQRGCEIPTVGC